MAAAGEQVSDADLLEDLIGPRADYDYRGAWKAGITPERYEHDNRQHWPSATSEGKMLKSPAHPTAWMEYFMRATGTDPNDLGLRTPEERDKEVRERDKDNECPADGHGVTGDNVTKDGTGHTGVTPSGTDKIRLDKTDTTTPQDIPGYEDSAGAREEAGGGCGEDYLDAPNVENAPSIEFQEIRAYFNAHGREEAPLTGFQEYLSLHATRQWPGQSAIYTAIDRLSAQDAPWRAGKAPGLAKFLKEQWWRMKPRSPARASPLAPPGQTVTERNEATAMQVLAEMEADENGN